MAGEFRFPSLTANPWDTSFRSQYCSVLRFMPVLTLSSAGETAGARLLLSLASRREGGASASSTLSADGCAKGCEPAALKTLDPLAIRDTWGAYGASCLRGGCGRWGADEEGGLPCSKPFFWRVHRISSEKGGFNANVHRGFANGFWQGLGKSVNGS